VTEGDAVWIARLTPTESSSVEQLLSVPLGLDVWERHPDSLVVAATDAQLAELERRRLAEVERWSTREQYVQDHDA
jgi:isocitrate lyase